MRLFWENITRYPRFLITSVSGLILIIFSSVIKFIQKRLANQIFLFVFLFIFVILSTFLFSEIFNI
jgi:hypothetical protein